MARGGVSSLGQPGARGCGFNGAAASLPRKSLVQIALRPVLLASMEPRHLCRGNATKALGNGAPHTSLQWSRGISAAEMRGAGESLLPDLAASMEPRHLCRGNLPLDGTRGVDRGASMEPRHLCRWLSNTMTPTK